ncbi:nck-associated protein 5-like isoform 2-T2 [Clarias gariepinus]|uniref:nck-associated protein 5-like isoform X2 n=1 Tax=Clarias gariepinus TaxID=13013 RepID=UPI00234C6CCE|nr:nck-associated protein 5-like isoform X2 [Clarias gariepinus]
MSELRKCDEASVSVEGDTDVLLEEDEEEDEEEEDETTSNKELLERLRELETENTSLALANESQREAYERCLDEVANHVVQALLNQKDLREECIKLKMRVFDLERQNRTLTDFLTHKLHFSSSPLHQLSSVCTDHRSDPSLVIVELPQASTSQGKVKDSEECAQNIIESSAQASSSSMEAMSPFLKKKAHILEVLRKLEESDPLKFPPSSCYHHHHPHTEPHLPGEVTSMVHLSPPQHQCRQSSSDSDLHEHTHAIGDRQQDSHASLNFGGCPSCLILQQRSSMELLKANKGSSVPTGSGKDDKRGQMWLEECGASGQTIDKTNHPCSEDPNNDCNKRQSSKISPTKTKSTNKFHQSSETIPSPKGGKMKQSPKKAAPCEKQEPEICNEELPATKETTVSKKASAASSYSSASLPERSTSAFLQQQVTEKKSTQSPASLFGESIPAAPTLLKLLKIPSASENMAASNAFRLSPQLTRNSKIPCRNNYEVQTRKATTTEQASSSKTDSHPETHSAPTSPPNNEETSSIPKKDPGFSSHSAPKSSKASKASAQVPHYENIEGNSTFNTTTATKDTTELSEKQKLNWRDEKILNPLSSDSSTSTSDSSSSSSDQETDTESPVWQRPQHHFSLPTSSSSANKAQRMSYPSMKDKYHDQGPPVASPKVGASGASQVVVKRRDRQSLVPDRREISSYSEMSYHPFKERLAVLGRLQNLEDMHQAGVKRGAQSNVSRPAASTGKGERSKTAERQIERITLEQRKHTGSLEGKSYPKNCFGNYAKVHASSSAAERKYITKPDSQKTRTGMPSTASCETLVVMRSYGKCPSPLNKTVPSPQSSPSRAQSKSPSKAGNASYPRGMKPVQEEHLNLQKHQSPKLTTRKKKAITQLDTFPPPLPSKSTLDSAKSVEEKRLSVPQSSIEQKVMRGIQENMLKLQEHDRGPAVEMKQKSSNGIASWFGLKKSKLPALNRKAELSKIKSNTSSSSTSSGTKDILGTKGGSRKVVESLNISKLMEKAEDLRKALEDERVYVKGVGIPLDHSVRGRSCEVIVDQTQGQLSLMYTGVTGDGFMQQLLNRVDDRGAPGFGIMHRRLSFDSKRSRPVFGHQQSCVRQTRSGEEIKCSEMSRGDDMTSDESLAESVSSQHFKGSMRTLDSGIGTFPLPNYANNAAGKLNPKLQSSSVSHQMAMKSRKTRTLEGGLASLDEVNTSVLYTSSLEAKGTSVHLSSTIHEDIDLYGGHFQASPTADWAFPKLRASEGQIEPPSQQTPTKRSLDKVPRVPRDVEPKNVSPSGGRRGKSRSHEAQETAGKDETANLMKDRSEELLSPNRPETVESLSDSLYDSLSSCGSQG